MPNPNPYWWDAFTPFESQPENMPSECDVVVVGAGLTGCSAALTLAKAGVNVVVFDAERPGYGGSTRNGGMVGGGYRLSAEEMDVRFGYETSQQLMMEANIHSLAFASERIKEENIDCDYNTYGRFRGQWNDAEYDATAITLEKLRKRIPVQIDMVPKEQQRREIGSDFYSGGMLVHNHGGLHPAKYLNGMLTAAMRAGAPVFGETPVTAVSKSGSGFEVTTSKGKIRAGSVLMATNGYTQRGFPQLKRRIIPLSSFLIATEELPPDLVDEILPTKRMCVETRNRHCYYRLSPDSKRFIIGGRAAMSSVLHGNTGKVLHGLMSEIFPQLSNAKTTHSWTGQTGFTFSFLPHVGQFGGVWHAMGYSGSGNAMAPYLGHKAALLMMGDPAGDTAFTKTAMETRAWYRKTPWFLPFAHQLYRLKDRLDDRSRGK